MIEAALQEVDGVQEAHDLHVWTILSGFVSLSAHVTGEERDPTLVLGEGRRLLMERLDIDHSTSQVQATACCAFGDGQRVVVGER